MFEPGPRFRSLLTRSRVDVTIDALLARYELRHGFHNHRIEPVEIVFTFPIPLDAAFLGMEATIGGVTRISRVQPRQEARETFDEAIAEGDSGVLLERLEPGLLCVDLGNLGPDERGEVVLRFAAALDVAGGTARFVLPLVHRPRYGRVRLDPASTPEPDFAVEHQLEAWIRVLGPFADAPVTCSSHAVRFERKEDALEMSLSYPLLDRDLVLAFELPDGASGAASLIADGGGAIGLLDLTAPVREPADEPLDLCLVLDGSGSMSGDAIAQARGALSAVVGLLRDEDRVQVLRFGTTVVPLLRRPLRATARVLEALRALVQVIDADLGGTEIEKALSAALDGLADGDGTRRRAILLVTDGAVQPHALDRSRERAVAAGVRIFVVAVGSSAGVDVLAPLAAATGAVLERTVPAESIDAAVLRQFRRARHAVPLAIEVDWGAGARALPHPVVYPGDAATLVAFLPDPGPRPVYYRCGPADEPTTLTTGAATPDPPRRAWAGQQAYLHAGGNTAEREALAMRYGLIAEETSAVLVQVRASGDKLDGLPAVVPIAPMRPAGMLRSQRRIFLPVSRVYEEVFSFQPDRSRRPAQVPAPVPQPVPDEFHLDEQNRGERLERARSLSPVRLAVVCGELRRVLELLLLSAPHLPFTRARLLAAVDPLLREDIEAWLVFKDARLASAREAATLLLDLAAASVATPLQDEDEALLSAMEFGCV